MKKIILISLVSLIAIVIACKKDNKTSSNTTSANTSTSQAFNILTSTKWKQTHSYIDTGTYAGANLSSWPLSTTAEQIQTYDTCWLTAKVWWRTSYDWLTIKGQGCSSSILDTTNNGIWALSANTAYLINDGTDSLNILELNNNYFKLWFKSVVTNSASVVIETDYTVWVFEPTQ